LASECDIEFLTRVFIFVFILSLIHDEFGVEFTTVFRKNKMPNCLTQTGRICNGYDQLNSVSQFGLSRW